MNTFYTKDLLYQYHFLLFPSSSAVSVQAEVTQWKSLKLHEHYPCTSQETVESS